MGELCGFTHLTLLRSLDEEALLFYPFGIF